MHRPPARRTSPAEDPADFCTLPPDGLQERLAWIRREILPHVVETLRLASGLAFELAAAPGLEGQLDRLIAKEAECCSGIVLERMESASPGRIRLEIRGVDPDAPLLRSLAGVTEPAVAPSGG